MPQFRLLLSLLLPLLLLVVQQATCQLQLTVTPQPIVMLTEERLPLNVTFNCSGDVPAGRLRFSIEDSSVALLLEGNETSRWLAGGCSDLPEILNPTLQGRRLGWTDMIVEFLVNDSDVSDEWVDGDKRWRVTALRRVDGWQIAYRVVLISMVVVIVFGMGCAVDLRIVLKLVKKPYALSAGAFAQFVIMPSVSRQERLAGIGEVREPLSFGVGQLFLLAAGDFEQASAFAFGILTIGCSPGGGSSNMWTMLFGGDLDLSMTMTFFSQLFALFMMPLWLFCYSRFYIDPNAVVIPYDQVAMALLQVAVPVTLGALLNLRFPKYAKKMVAFTKPFTLVFVLFVVIVGTVINLYLYELVGQIPIIILFGGLLPWLGFALGYSASLVWRLPRGQAIAIALECGIQNAGIPLQLLQFSMPKPDGDLAGVVPLMVVILTPFPLYFILLGMRLRQWRQKRLEKKKEMGGEIPNSELDVVQRQNGSVQQGDLHL